MENELTPYNHQYAHEDSAENPFAQSGVGEQRLGDQRRHAAFHIHLCLGGSILTFNAERRVSGNSLDAAFASIDVRAAALKGGAK